jgi:DNA-directed RNA polymerase subunit RPC12/RpoP
MKKICLRCLRSIDIPSKAEQIACVLKNFIQARQAVDENAAV